MPEASRAGSSNASPWVVDDIVKSERADDFHISPDCRWAVWVKSAPDKEKGEHVSHLMLSSLTRSEEIQLTRGDVSCTQPRWSPDGKHIAFVAARPLPKGVTKDKKDDEKPKTQLWVMRAFGGEPWHLTEGARDIQRYAWANAETIVCAVQEDRTLYEMRHKEQKDESVVVDDEEHEPPVRLFKAGIVDKRVVRLTDNADRIRLLALSPGGRHAVTKHERSLHFEYDNRIKPLVYLYDLETGERKQILDDPHLDLEYVRWDRDGGGFYAIVAFSPDPRYLTTTISELYRYDLANGEPVKVDLDWENGLAFLGQTFDVTPDGFVTLLADGARPKAARYVRGEDGWQRAWLEGEHAGHLFGVRMGADGETLLYEYTTASVPHQWYRARLEGARVEEPMQLTQVNAHLEGKTFARAEVVHWSGALDEEVEGILCYPHDYEPGRRYPLVVMIHGGPAWADFDSWRDSLSSPQNLINQRGAFVLRPNYHGSAFYGLDWVTSIANGKYYDLEVPDIERGVDALIDKGLVDPDRLGVMGWSNGGILTIALTVETTRYKAASAGAGDVDWSSDWANCAFGAAFDNTYLGASPLEDPQRYLEKSPFYRLDRVRTPTLIFFGDQDTAVPTQQGWMHYRALQQTGHVDVRFVLFPGEKHGLKKLSSWRRKVEEELAWFDRYLFQALEKKNPAVKLNSPLDSAIKRQRAARVGGAFGMQRNGVLVPETVPYKGLELGRFEVTRAQYAAFDAAYPVSPGRENYPANGIAFDQALAYCAWLSDQTGEMYRLGSEAEMAEVYRVEKAVENTLDYWAGYAVNPEDAERLRDEIAQLGAGALLHEVGHFQGTDTEQPVFDLGGNVAEWVIAEGGGGRVLGGSADAPADARAQERKPSPAYIGFRVVRGRQREQDRSGV
jgi:dipeptidyl aminopeptidase/acylaminoacyl peptidase